MIGRMLKQYMAILIMLLSGLLAACQTAVPPTPTLTPTTAAATPTAVATQPPAPTSTRPPAPTPTAEPDAARPDLGYLQAAIDDVLADFDGVASYTVVDLATGERIEREPDVALAGMSLVKVPLLVETYRALDQSPNIEQTKLITQTTALSSNFAANLLLRDVVGQGDIFAGADTLTASMRELGLFNTFIAVPYDLDPPPGRLNTYITPANQRTDVTTLADPYRQTTVGDLTLILEQLYACAETGHGRLTQTYPNTITQAECAEILEMLRLNELVKLIEAGLPADTPIAHKVGYIDDTYGDAAIVYSPAGDYILVLALYKPVYLEWAESSPLYEQISALTYAHFNDPDAYPPEVLAQEPDVVQPTAVATPQFPQAIVFGTQGIGLTLRSQPGGGELAILPDGTVVGLLPAEPVEQGGVLWRNVRAADGREGWVGADYLVMD